MSLQTARVLIAAFCDPRTVHYRGYTEKAVRMKVGKGVWREGQVLCRAPDGHLMIDMEGYERWAAGEKAAA